MDLSLRHSDKKRKAMPCRHRPGVKTGARPTEAGATGKGHDPCSESSNAIVLGRAPRTGDRTGCGRYGRAGDPEPGGG